MTHGDLLCTLDHASLMARVLAKLNAGQPVPHALSVMIRQADAELRAAVRSAAEHNGATPIAPLPQRLRDAIG